MDSRLGINNDNNSKIQCGFVRISSLWKCYENEKGMDMKDEVEFEN